MGRPAISEKISCRIFSFSAWYCSHCSFDRIYCKLSPFGEVETIEQFGRVLVPQSSRGAQIPIEIDDTDPLFLSRELARENMVYSQKINF